MAAKSNLKNMVLCLFGTCLFCSAILGGVYAITEKPIAETNKKIQEAATGAVLVRNAEGTGLADGSSILPKADTVLVDGTQFEYFTQVLDGQPIAYAIKSTVTGFGGPLTLMVGISPERKILSTKVLSHSETPGLGAKCDSDEKFISQWRGLDLNVTKLEVQKPVKDGIDAITASTITSKAYTKAVAAAVAALDAIKSSETSSVISSEVEKSLKQEVPNE